MQDVSKTWEAPQAFETLPQEGQAGSRANPTGLASAELLRAFVSSLFLSGFWRQPGSSWCRGLCVASSRKARWTDCREDRGQAHGNPSRVGQGRRGAALH